MTKRQMGVQFVPVSHTMGCIMMAFEQFKEVEVFVQQSDYIVMQKRDKKM